MNVTFKSIIYVLIIVT